MPCSKVYIQLDETKHPVKIHEHDLSHAFFKNLKISLFPHFFDPPDVCFPQQVAMFFAIGMLASQRCAGR